jgi:hypothetical protein
VTRPQAPKFLSDITVGEDQPWELSQPFATEGMLYLSYRFFGDLKPASRDDNTRTQETSDGPPTPGSDAARANRHFLVRVDYADPTQPEIDDTQVNFLGSFAASLERAICFLPLVRITTSRAAWRNQTRPRFTSVPLTAAPRICSTRCRFVPPTIRSRLWRNDLHA